MLFSVQSFAQVINGSKLDNEFDKGGSTDQDALLFIVFFDAEEGAAMIADPQNDGHPLTKKITFNESNDGKRSLVMIKSPVSERKSVYSFTSPTTVKGYILLNQQHRKHFLRYDLYDENGALKEG